MHVADAHTDGDAIVRFRKVNALHMGNVFFVGSYPFTDTKSGGSFNGMIDALASALASVDDQTRIIAGHGPHANKAKMQEFHDMLVSIRGRNVKQIRAGKSMESVLASKPTAEFDAAWAGTFWKRDQWVARAYTDLRRSAGK